MHIEISKLATIGDASADSCDYSVGQLGCWESTLSPRPTFHSVAVLDAEKQDLFTEEYAYFISRFEKYSRIENFLLMTTDGVILCSAIGGNFEVLQGKLPVEALPLESTNTTVASDIQRLEDIARSYIKGRLDALDETVNRSEIESIFYTAYRKVVLEIAKNPDSLGELDWRDLERVLAEAFRGIGFSVELTPGSKDGGKDLILTCVTGDGERSYYVEVKHWRSRKGVGGKYLDDFMQIVVSEKQHGGLFLSTYGYSNQAIELLCDIEKRTVRLGDSRKIVALCQSYVKSASGVVIPSKELPDILFCDTW